MLISLIALISGMTIMVAVLSQFIHRKHYGFLVFGVYLIGIACFAYCLLSGEKEYATLLGGSLLSWYFGTQAGNSVESCK